MDVKISGNFDEVQRIIKSLPSKISEPALVQSLNKTGRSAKAKGRRAISSSTGVKLKATRGRVTGAAKGAAASRKSPSLTIYIRTLRGVPFSKAFTKSQIKKTSSVERSSFTATMTSGKFSRFKRVGSRRLPIEELKVPLDPHATRSARRAIKQHVENNIVKELKRSIVLRISKLKRRGK